MSVFVEIIYCTTTGSAGSASATVHSNGVITGELLGFYIDYDAAAPATTDVTIKSKGSTQPSHTFLTRSNSATDGYFPVRVAAVDSSNSAITGSYVEYAMSDHLTVTVAQSDAITNAVTVYAYYRC